jgi:drug/metabolite transporter (DMT)-like permease
LGYAVCNVCIRRWLSHVGSLPLSFQALAVSGLVLLPLSLATSDTHAATGREWTVAITSVVVLGVFGTGVAIWLFNKLIQEQGPLFAGMVTNLIPVGAVLWGWADQEPVTRIQIAALIGIVLMVTLVQFGAARTVSVMPHRDEAPH